MSHLPIKRSVVFWFPCFTCQSVLCQDAETWVTTHAFIGVWMLGKMLRHRKSTNANGWMSLVVRKYFKCSNRVEKCYISTSPFTIYSSVLWELWVICRAVVVDPPWRLISCVSDYQSTSFYMKYFIYFFLVKGTIMNFVLILFCSFFCL